MSRLQMASVTKTVRPILSLSNCFIGNLLPRCAWSMADRNAECLCQESFPCPGGQPGGGEFAYHQDTRLRIRAGRSPDSPFPNTPVSQARTFKPDGRTS